MNKKIPGTPEEANEGSLDEYGVWVKAGSEEQVVESDELVSDLLDDSPEDSHTSPREIEMPVSMEDNMFLMEPETGGLPGKGIIQKGQEVDNMSETNKTRNASSTNDTTGENEIMLDSADELALSSADDDLGGLSDLLLNIDEENDEDDTIYLEDDDLSFDLDQENEDLLLDQEADSQSPDDFGEDIVIPGLDDELHIESESSGEGLDLLNDSLDELEETTSPETLGENFSRASNLESHGVEEVGLDEFLDENIETSTEDDSMSLLEEETFGSPGAQLDNSIELDEDAAGVLETSLDSFEDSEVDIDLGPEISLDEASFGDIDTISLDDDIDDLLPGASNETKNFGKGSSSDSRQFSDLEMQIDEPLPAPAAFDDVAAFTDDVSAVNRKDATQESAPSRILLSIEEELQAIRSELTDLRTELKKLRSRDGNASVALSELDDADALEPAVFSQEEQDLEDQLAGGGFFDDDEDETIALTGDELDNILNTADFTEEAGEPSSLDPDEESMTGDSNELGGIDVPVSLSEYSFSDSREKDFGKGTEVTEMVFEDDDQSVFPPIEEISLEEIRHENEPMSKPATALAFEESFDDEIETLGDDETDTDHTRAIEQLAQLDIEKELSGIEDLKDAEDDIELYSGGELDSLELEIPEDFENSKLTDGDSELLDASIDELDEIESVQDEIETAPRSAFPTEQDPDISFSLKQEIKAVLAYMDQLLESLPEEKIEEFAQSEHFEVYKKLFDELGL